MLLNEGLLVLDYLGKLLLGELVQEFFIEHWHVLLLCKLLYELLVIDTLRSTLIVHILSLHVGRM